MSLISENRIPYKRIIFVLFQIENDWDHLQPSLISKNPLYSHPLYPNLTVAITIENLLNNLKLKKQERFVTWDVKKQIEILVESGEIAEEKSFEIVESFYDTSLQYADKWICNLGNTNKFKWILLNKTPAWKEIGDSINHKILTCVQAEETRLFDQWVLIKLIAERQVDKWNEKNLLVSDRWLHIFREMRKKHLDFQDFCNVVGFSFTFQEIQLLLRECFLL